MRKWRMSIDIGRREGEAEGRLRIRDQLMELTESKGRKSAGAELRWQLELNEYKNQLLRKLSALCAPFWKQGQRDEMPTILCVS